MQAGSLYLNYQYGFGNKVKLRGDHTNEVDKDNTLKWSLMGASLVYKTTH